MNHWFKKYIDKAILKIDGEFTARMVLSKVIDMFGNGRYIGTTSGIGFYLQQKKDIEVVKNGSASKTYRRIKNDD